MKNREYKTLVAIVLAMTLAAGTLAGGGSAVYAKENTVKTETSAGQADGESASGIKPVKDETVYAKIDGSGTVTSVTVSDQLKNITDESEIKDISTLENIENVKGDETFFQNSNALTWSGDSKDICYQGTTNQALPVGVNITYKLDGKTISAEELEGKSGHLMIHYQYVNTTAGSGKKYTPFLMITGLILDSDKFTNAKVTNGKLVSDGDRDMVLGMGLPELESSLGVTDLDIPDYFELEADVTDYEAAEGITIATNEIFNDLDMGKLDSLSDLKSSMNKLQDSANQLADGSGELRKGLDTLLSSSGTLTDGIGQLADGSSTLKNGTGTLLSGSNTLAEGSTALADGTSQLLAGTGTLKEGTNTLNAGLATAADKTANQLLPGIIQLDDGVAQMQKQLGDGLSELTAGVQTLDAGAASLRDGAAYLNQVINSGTAETGGVSLASIAGNTADGAQYIAEAAGGISQTVTAVSDATASAAANTGAAIGALEALKAEGGDSLTEEQTAAINNAIAALSTDMENIQSAANTLGQQAAQAGGLAEGASSVASGAGSTSQIINGLSASVPELSQGASDIADGTAQLNASITDPEKGLAVQVSSGVETLKNGTAALRAGIDGDAGLASGLQQLSAGASQVDSGAGTLNEKMAEANNGAQSVSAGASQLSSGAGELDSGAGTLASGIQTLQSGSGTLIDGVKQLDEGAKTLNEGMIQFNEEGIQKLVSAFDGDIQGLLDKLNDMADASKSYNNFSGIAGNMDGEVKFIFVTNK